MKKQKLFEETEEVNTNLKINKSFATTFEKKV